MIARIGRLTAKWWSIPLLLALWQATVMAGLVQSRLLPSFAEVLRTLISQVIDGPLVDQAAITFGRAFAGFALAAIVGVPFSAMMARSTLFRNLFEPVFFFGYPVPKIALFPIFTYMFGFGTPSKVAFTFLECLYPIVVNAYLGFRGVPTRLVWTAENCGASKWMTFRRVILPAATPSIFSGLRIALPIAIIVVVLTEMIGDSKGLGYYINVWSTRFTFENVYAAIIVIAVCGLAFDACLVSVRGRVIGWENERRR